MNARVPVAIAPRALALAVVALAAACGNPRLEQAWCSDAPRDPGTPWSEMPTWHEDVKPIVEARCATCHSPGGIAPFALTTYDDAYTFRAEIAATTATHTMPPFLAARCCTEYFADWSLGDAEIATLDRWVAAGAPEGDPAAAPRMTLPPAGGLSRVDVRVTMPEPYEVRPKPGRSDDFRCFLLDWPIDEPVFVTGIDPVPGNRGVVHHLIVAALTGGAIDAAREADAEDDRPGYDCEGGLGDIPLDEVTMLGGSLLGSDFPDGLGRRVEPGSKILLNVHYTSNPSAPPTDQTSVEFRIDAGARPFHGMVIANPAWLVSDGLLIEAGDPDAAFWFRYSPSVFTKNEPVLLRSVTPHMHYFGKRMRVMLLRDGGGSECLLEIPAWDFGWEQPFWLAEPRRFDPGDELYIECVFDNSAANQPTASPPRDIAWGTDNQDMCAAFLSFTRGSE